jgi:hypothetical protein
MKVGMKETPLNNAPRLCPCLKHHIGGGATFQKGALRDSIPFSKLASRSLLTPERVPASNNVKWQAVGTMSVKLCPMDWQVLLLGTSRTVCNRIGEQIQEGRVRRWEVARCCACASQQVMFNFHETRYEHRQSHYICFFRPRVMGTRWQRSEAAGIRTSVPSIGYKLIRI